MKVERLSAKHYDDILSLLNAVFSRKNGREMDFEKEMPKMCVRDDEHMGYHLGIFDNERLVACMGVYPYEVIVAGKKLRFATTGNIAVHWEYEGKGYMGKMVDAAMEELERLDVDAARLGGLRSRYNRYGFESCGQNYGFTFTEKNRKRKFPQYKGGITFKQITAEDTDALEFAVSLYNKNQIIVPRNVSNAYDCLTMWQNVPYLAIENGTAIGYLTATESGDAIAEVDAVNTKALSDIICAWQEKVEQNIFFYRQAHQIDSLRVFTAVCEGAQIYSPSHFKIRKWEKVVDAFIKLKASYSEVTKGELCIEIEDYGTIRLFSNENGVGCEKTNKNPDITLDRLSAARYIFGPHPPVFTADALPIAQAWFPLPLSWNGQDRL